MVKDFFVIGLFIIVTGVQSLYAGSGGGGGSRVASEELIPAIVELRGVGKSDIQVVYRKGKAFLPMMSIFQFLNIKAEFSSDHSAITGFYPRPGRNFSFDILNGRFKSADTSATLSTADYTFSEDEVYLEESNYRALFHIKIHYNDRRILVTIMPSPDLPVIAAKARETARRIALARIAFEQPDYIVDRYPSLADFGKINWYLSSNAGPHRAPQTLYDFRVGGKIIDGDAYMTIRDYIGKRVKEYNVHGYLVYPFLNNDALSEIRIGDIEPATPTSRNVIGVEITNRPAPRRLFFGKQDLHETLPASSEVEFYYNSTLTNYILTRADSEYQFSIPLHYGTADYEVRTYDHWGVEQRNLTRAVIPSEMLPVNETQYSISGGKIRGYNDHAGNMNIGHGFTQALTLNAGVDLFDRNFAERIAYPYVQGAARLTSSLIGNVYVSPLSLSQIDLEYQTPQQLDYALTQTVYADDPVLNPGALLSATTARVSIPIVFNDREIGINLTGINSVSHYSHQRGFIGNLAFHVPGTSLAYTLEYSEVSTGAEYATNIFTSSPSVSVRAPANMIFAAGFTYDHENSRLEQINLGVEHPIINGLYVDLTFTRLYQPTISLLRLQINYNFPFMSFSSTSNKVLNDNSGFGTGYTNAVGGQIFFSEHTGDVFFQYTRQADRGALLVRPFVDANDNGVHDDGEEFLPQTRLATQSYALHVNPVKSSKGTLLTNIEPYQQYNLFVDSRNTFDNPQLVSKYRGLGVIGEPGMLKIVDYPVVMGGNIRGSVMLRGKGTPTAVEGLRIMLQTVGAGGALTGQSRKTLTFSDGTFEFLAVPPGSYMVSISAIDLREIGVSATVLTHPVTVVAKPEGDQIEGIDFEVH